MLLKIFSVVLALVASALTAAETYVHSTLGTSTVWAATRWTPDDIVLFGGMPAYTTRYAKRRDAMSSCDSGGTHT